RSARPCDATPSDPPQPPPHLGDGRPEPRPSARQRDRGILVSATNDGPELVLAGTAVFLSASIPDPTRWTGDFDALEIIDAVVAVGRSMLSAGARLVTAAHPTIAPLLLYVAAELPHAPEPRVVVYQSGVFDSVMPEATRRFEADGVGTLIRTEPVD